MRKVRGICPGTHGIWHADISQINIKSQKYYLYLLIDNYSRMILNWRLASKVSGKIMRDVLSEAMAKFQPLQTQLLVDGGPENHNQEVDQLLSANPHRLTKVTAQKDIRFSNSMVEAVFKIIKYNYLFRMDISSFSELKNKVKFIVNDYNQDRPHGSLNGLTPVEKCYGSGISTAKLKIQIQQAKKERVRKNRNNSCPNCPKI